MKTGQRSYALIKIRSDGDLRLPTEGPHARVGGDHRDLRGHDARGGDHPLQTPLSPEREKGLVPPHAGAQSPGLNERADHMALLSVPSIFATIRVYEASGESRLGSELEHPLECAERAGAIGGGTLLPIGASATGIAGHR